MATQSYDVSTKAVEEVSEKICIVILLNGLLSEASALIVVVPTTDEPLAGSKFVIIGFWISGASLVVKLNNKPLTFVSVVAFGGGGESHPKDAYARSTEVIV